jgi:hypothetical protein
MTQFNWKFEELLTTGGKLSHVQYLLTATDGEYSVSTTGTHAFKEGTVSKSFEEIVELDIRQWIEKDTTQSEVNLLKSNLEKQISYLKNAPKKAQFPWLADTFTIE